MAKQEKLFNDLAEKLGTKHKGVELSQMFGKPCIKIKGKAFSCFFQDEMVFKLTGDEHKTAMALKGSKLFDPSGKGRAMKEWVQVNAAHSAKWTELSEQALKFVSSSK